MNKRLHAVTVTFESTAVNRRIEYWNRRGPSAYHWTATANALSGKSGGRPVAQLRPYHASISYSEELRTKVRVYDRLDAEDELPRWIEDGEMRIKVLTV